MPHQSNLNEHEAPDARRTVRKFTWVEDGKSRKGQLRAKWVGPGQRRPRYGEDARKALAQQAKAARPEAARIQQLAAERRAKWAAETNKESKLAQGYRAEANALDAIAGGKSVEEALAGLPIVSRAILKAFLKRQDAAPQTRQVDPHKVAEKFGVGKYAFEQDILREAYKKRVSFKTTQEGGGYSGRSRIGEVIFQEPPSEGLARAVADQLHGSVLRESPTRWTVVSNTGVAHAGTRRWVESLAAAGAYLSASTSVKKRFDKKPARHLDRHVKALEDLGGRIGEGKASLPDVLSTILHLGGTLKAGDLAALATRLGSDAKPKSKDDGMRAIHDALVARYRTARTRFNSEKSFAELQSDFKTTRGTMAGVTTDGRKVYGKEYERLKAKKKDVAKPDKVAERRKRSAEAAAERRKRSNAAMEVWRRSEKSEVTADKPLPGREVFKSEEHSLLARRAARSLADSGFDEEMKGKAVKWFAAATRHMPEAALAKLAIGAGKINFFASNVDAENAGTKDVLETVLKSGSGKAAGWAARTYMRVTYALKGLWRKYITRDSTVGGIFNAHNGNLFLGTGKRGSGKHHFDADEEGSAIGVYTHELAHALDGRNPLGARNTRLSNSKEWQDAWRQEILGVDTMPLRALLTKYAETSEAEGFAEFARLLYATPTKLSAIETRFPKASAFFKKHGFWPAKSKPLADEGDELHIPELFLSHPLVPLMEKLGLPVPDMMLPKKKPSLRTFADAPLRHIRNVEIFATGRHRDEQYDEPYLDRVVENFNKLGKVLHPTVVIGHEEEQDLLDNTGIPAVGVVEKVWKTKVPCRVCEGAGKFEGKPCPGCKGTLKQTLLKADFADVPPQIADLVNKRAYRQVSAELYDDFDHQGHNYGPALRRVAMLGGELPQVKTLKDLPFATFSAGRRARSVRFFCDGQGRCHIVRPSTMKPRLVRVGTKLVVQFAECKKCDQLQPCPQCANKVDKFAIQQTYRTKTGGVGVITTTGQRYTGKKAQEMIAAAQRRQQKTAMQQKAAPNRKPLDVSKLRPRERQTVEMYAKMQGVSLDTHDVIGRNMKTGEMVFRPKQGGAAPAEQKTQKVVQPKPQVAPKPQAAKKQRSDVEFAKPLKGDGEVYLGPGERDPEGTFDADAYEAGEPKPESIMTKDNIESFEFFPDEDDPNWADKWEVFETVKQARRSKTTTGNVQMDSNGMIRRRKKTKEQAFSEVSMFASKPVFTRTSRGTWKAEFPGTNRKPVYGKEAQRLMQSAQKAGRTQAAKQVAARQAMGGKVGLAAAKAKGERAAKQLGMDEKERAEYARSKKARDELVTAHFKAEADKKERAHALNVKAAVKELRKEMMVAPADAAKQGVSDKTHYGVRNPRTGEILGYMPRGKGPSAEQVKARIAEWRKQHDENMASVVATVKADYDDAAKLTTDQANQAAKYIENANLPKSVIQEIAKAVNISTRGGRTGKQLKKLIAEAIRERHGLALRVAADSNDPESKALLAKNNLVSDESMQDFLGRIGGATSDYLDGARLPSGEYMPAGANEKRGDFLARFGKAREKQLADQEKAAYEQALKDAYTVVRKRRQGITNEQAAQEVENEVRKKFKFKHYKPPTKNSEHSNFADCQRRITEFCMEGKNKGKPGPCPGEKGGKASNILARMQAKKKDAATPAQFKPAWSKAPAVTPPPEMPKDIPVAQPVAQPVQVVIRMENGVPTLAKAEPAAQPGVVDSIQRPRQKIEGPVAAPASPDEKSGSTWGSVGRGLWDITKGLWGVGKGAVKGLAWMLWHRRKKPGGAPYLPDPMVGEYDWTRNHGGIIPRALRLAGKAALFGLSKVIAPAIRMRSELGQKVIRLTMMAERILARRQGRPPRRWKGSTIIRVANQQIRRFAEELKGGAGLLVRPFRTFDVGGGLRREWKTSRGTMAGETMSGRKVYGKEYRRLKQQQAAKVKSVGAAPKPKTKQDSQGEAEEAAAEAIGQAADILKGTWQHTIGAGLKLAGRGIGKAASLAIGEKAAKRVGKAWDRSVGQILPDLGEKVGYLATSFGRNVAQPFTLDKEAIARVKADRLAWAKEVATAKREGRPEPTRPATATQLYKELRSLYSPTGEANLIHANTGVAPWVYKSLKSAHGKVPALLGTLGYTAANLATGGSGLGAGTLASYLIGGALGLPVIQGAAALQAIPGVGPWLARGKNAILGGLTRGATYLGSAAGKKVDQLAKWMLGGDKSQASKGWSRFWRGVGRRLEWTAGKVEKAASGVGKALAHGIDMVPRGIAHGVNLLLRPFGKGFRPGELNRRIDAEGGAPEYVGKQSMRLLWNLLKAGKSAAVGLVKGAGKAARSVAGLLFSEAPTWLAPAVRCFRETEAAHRRVLGLGPSPLTDRQVRVCIEAMVAAAA